MRRVFWVMACCCALLEGQTQIDLGRQVRNALPYSSGGTAASSQVTARANVGTPARVATDFPGADVGEQINNAFASFGLNQNGNPACGEVLVPGGFYSFSTPIFVPPGCTLEGAGNGAFFTGLNSATQLEYHGPPATAAIVVSMSSSYQQGDDGHVRNLYIGSRATPCPSNGMLRWNPSAAGANKWQCAATAAWVNISAVTNGTPVQVTAASHGLSTGDRVEIDELRWKSELIGEWTVTVVDANNVTLNSSTGSGNVYVSGAGRLRKITYSAPTAHLAGIQHGQVSPGILGDGSHVTVENVFIEGNNGGQGGFHFGLYFNGCEECWVSNVHTESCDIGFEVGPASNGSLFQLAVARGSKRAGIHLRNAGSSTWIAPMVEGNTAAGIPQPSTPDLGIGILADNEYSGGQGSMGDRLYSVYFEANWFDAAIGTVAAPFNGVIQAVGSRINRGNTMNVYRLYSSDATIRGCTIPDPTQVHVFNGGVFHNCNLGSGASFDFAPQLGGAQGYEVGFKVDAMTKRVPAGVNGIGFLWDPEGYSNQGFSQSPFFISPPGSTVGGGAAMILTPDTTQATATEQSLLSPVINFAARAWASTPGASQPVSFSLGAVGQPGASAVSGYARLQGRANAGDFGGGPELFRFWTNGNLDFLPGGSGSNFQTITSAPLTASRTLTLPDGNSNPVQPSTAAANQFATGISSAGIISYAQPSIGGTAGFKHQSVSTGTIGAASSAAVTLTWASAFADANYNPICGVEEATAGTGTIRLHHIESFSAGAVVVRVVNDDGSNPHSGTLRCFAAHN